MARGMEIGEDLVGTFLRRVDDGRVEYRILGEQIAQRPRVAAARHIGVPGGEAGMLAQASFSAKKARVRPSASSAPSSLRSEEHTSELQSLMRNSYAVFCLKKKKKYHKITIL